MSVNDILKKITTNGSVFVGVSTGVDRALPIDTKLRHLDKRYDYKSAEHIITAISHVDQSLLDNAEFGKLIVGAIIFIYTAKLVDISSDDVVKVSGSGGSTFTGTIDESDISEAGTVVIATKITFFQTNHHVGTGQFTGFAAKVFNTIFAPRNVDVDMARTVFHTIGHWASTHAVLAALGYRNLKHVNLVGGKITVGLSEDVKMRLGSYPAGTAKIGLAVACLRKAVTHPIFPLIYDKHQIELLKEMSDAIKGNPVAHHMGAFFLLDGDPAEIDEDAIGVLRDKLFTFIIKVYPKSTLAKSPIIPRDPSNLENYDDIFAMACQQYVTNVNNVVTKEIKDIIDSIKPSAQNVDANVRRDVAAMFRN
ncbi:hypothetical protein [Beihai sesarmid crab virus 4]|uniref:Uncharacterized protein n=1 Tax=Beihai sesarmid crab virus 4 TaxID=1922664 RepID=A0A1L3KKX7_9VIRU|nr:hypothetical protein [Beihai sesarmid crab virus 4]APG78068.1 hypothetical protein [Beihai sesarmid crab virus 4]